MIFLFLTGIFSIALTQNHKTIISSEETIYLDLFKNFNFHEIPSFSYNESCFQNLTFSERSHISSIDSPFKQKKISGWLYFKLHNQIIILFDDNFLVLFEITPKKTLNQKTSVLLNSENQKFSQIIQTKNDGGFLLSFYDSQHNTNLFFFELNGSNINTLRSTTLKTRLTEGKIAINSGLFLYYKGKSIEIYIIINQTFLIQQKIPFISPILFSEEILEIVPRLCLQNFLECPIEFFITSAASFNRYTLNNNGTLTPSFKNVSIANIRKVLYVPELNLYFVITQKKIQLYLEKNGKLKLLPQTFIEISNNTVEFNIYYGADYLAISYLNITPNANFSGFYVYKKRLNQKDNFLFDLFYNFALRNSGFFFIENFGMIFLNDSALNIFRINSKFTSKIIVKKTSEIYCEGYLNFTSNNKNFSQQYLIIPLDSDQITIFNHSKKEVVILENQMIFEVNVGLPEIVGSHINISNVQSQSNEFKVDQIHNKFNYYNLSGSNLTSKNISGIFRIENKKDQGFDKQFNILSYDNGTILNFECYFELLSLNLADQEFKCYSTVNSLRNINDTQVDILQMELFEDGTLLMLFTKSGKSFIKLGETFEKEFENAQSFEILKKTKQTEEKAFFIITSEHDLFFVSIQSSGNYSKFNISSESAKFDKMKVFFRNFHGKTEMITILALEANSQKNVFYYFSLNTSFNSNSILILQTFQIAEFTPPQTSKKDINFFISKTPKSLIIVIRSSSTIVQFSYDFKNLNFEFFSFKRKFPILKEFSFSLNNKSPILSPNDFLYIKVENNFTNEIWIYDVQAQTPNMLVWKFQNIDQNCNETQVLIPDFINSWRKDIIIIKECQREAKFIYFDNKVLYKLRDITLKTRFLQTLNGINLKLSVFLNTLKTLTLKFPLISTDTSFSTTIKFLDLIKFLPNKRFCLKDLESGHVFLNQMIDMISKETLENNKFHDFSELSELFFSDQSLNFDYFAFSNISNNFIGISQQNAYNFSLAKSHANVLTSYIFPFFYQIIALTEQFIIFLKNYREVGFLTLKNQQVLILNQLNFRGYLASSFVQETNMLYILMKGKKGYRIRAYAISNSIFPEFFDFPIDIPNQCKSFVLQTGNLKDQDDIVFLFFQENGEYSLLTLFHQGKQRTFTRNFQIIPWFQRTIQITTFSFIVVKEFQNDNIAEISHFFNTKQSAVYEFSMELEFFNESKNYFYKILNMRHIHTYNHFPGCIYRKEFSILKIDNSLVLSRVCKNLDKEVVVFFIKNFDISNRFYSNISGSSPFFFKGNIKRVILKKNPTKMIIFLRQTVLSFNINLEGACFDTLTPGNYAINAINLYDSVTWIVSNSTTEDVSRAQIVYLALIGLSGIAFLCLIGLVVYCICQRRKLLSFPDNFDKKKEIFFSKIDRKEETFKIEGKVINLES